jgi:hypothetical protein
MLPGITPALFGGASLGNDQFTVLLCHFDGPNGSNQILDSSPKLHGVATVSGAPTVTAGSPLTGGVSVLVLPASGYVSFPNSSDWEFGAGDFTVDWWEYRNAAAGCSIARDFTTTYCPFLLHFGANGEIYMSSTGNSWDIANGVSGTPGFGPPPLGTWRHLAVTRQGSTFRAFINGVIKSTWTSSLAIYPNSNPLAIGGAQTAQYPNLYMDELRISKGIARWTANFTPPTKPYAPNPDGTMKLLMHFDTATGLTDSSIYKRVGVAQGPAAISTTQKKFSDASYYEPNNCWISFNPSPDFDFGAADFTMEWWEYRLDAADVRCIGSRDWGTYTYQGWMLYSTNGHVTFYTSNTGSSWDVVGMDLGTIDVNTWVHRAVCRQGSTFRGFKNGVLQGTATSSLPLYPGQAGLGIALGLWYPGSTAYYFNGYLDEFRIDSVARYTANFTPPIMPYGADPNVYATKLLLHFDGPNGDTRMPDASQFKHGFATISGSTAKVTTAQSKFGVSAYSNDGSNSYISFPDSDDWYFSGDFTVECWMRLNALPPTGAAYGIAHQVDGSNYWVMFVNEVGNVYMATHFGGADYGPYGPAQVVPNQWAHVALVQSAGVQTIYVNGVGGIPATVPPQPNLNSALNIGTWAGTWFFNGYIDEFRISNGIARWTANFTPPTAPYDPPLLVLPGPATPQTIAIGSGSQWTVPADWTSGKNSIEVIGGGGGGGGGISTSVGAGGGGGGYAKITNLALTPGAVINYAIGAGGGGGPTGGNGGGTGGQTWFRDTSTVAANGGAGGGLNMAGQGGAGGGFAAGASGFSGGYGGKGGSGNNGGGGGGAAGPNGAGGAAPNGAPGVGSMPGGAGDAGFGGAGAGQSGQGGAGTEWGSWGSGGGGGGGASTGGGGPGGAYGGGGGGANRAAGGQGLQGLIIIKYG